jgi:PAS domain S-box-containing protein
MRASILLLMLLLIPTVAAESTILSAKKAQVPIELDGHAIEEDWKQANELIIKIQDGSIGKVEVSLKALYDKEYLYIYATWPDPTQSIGKDMWEFNGVNWTSSGNEDRIGFIWNVDNSISGFNIGGCAMICHGDRMHTNSPGELGDLWHWKAGRTNPLGYADDEWIDNAVVEGYTEEAKEGAIHADGTELLYKEGYLKNINSDGTGPKYYEPNPEDTLDGKFIFWEEVENGDAVEASGNTRFSAGDLAPGYILKRPAGNRADIDAKGTWQGGKWQLELRRRLNTGYDNDVQFEIDKTYRFGVAVMDNTGGFEAYGKGHSFDLGARTLEFGGLGAEEVTRLGLVRDYLTIAEVHAAENETAMAVSNIGDALILYNEVGAEVGSIDPELYLSTKNQFMEVKRIPTREGIGTLMGAIDTTILTFQGKREPPEAPFKLKLLVVWGKVQLYVLILLALLSINPIYRAIQVGRKPTFRRLSVFILVIVIPLLFEGIGRVGILLKISLLQNFSFLTNELATLQWAVLMFFGLFMAKSGFEEVEGSITSMEFYSSKLEEDIGKMKRLESELRSSEERYRSIFEASPIGILEVNPDGSIIGCNAAASRIINCPDGECDCKSFLNFIKESDERKEISALLSEGGSAKDKFISIRGMNGKDLIASMSVESIMDEKGTPLKSEIALMDITDRVRADEERITLEKKLAHSEKLASIGKLATGFAHEISNPLTNIQLAAEILSKKESRKEAKERIEVITQNVDMASSVVRDLLDFSRETELNIVSIDLKGVLVNSLKTVSPRLKSIKVIKKLEKPIKIMGDPKQLQQVFANIIINAVQAMPQGGTLTIKSKLDEPLAVVSFTDTGQGIPEEQLKKIFDPFFTTKEVGTGTGLGLSLIYGIVKAHGGDIDVKSTTGKGTTVTIRLPTVKTKGKSTRTMETKSKAKKKRKK